MTLRTKILARSLPLRWFVLCAIAAATAHCAAQQPDDAGSVTPQTQTPAPTPAPIVRKAPKPASPSGDAPSPATQPHLTVAKPVSKPASSTAPSAAKTPAPKAPVSTPQPGPSGPFNRNVVLLDPAHGGGDTGSRISDTVTEKDITLALAFHIRSLLNARGFTTVMTRESDDVAATPSGTPGTPLTLADRAGMANHARPLACLLLHATASGSGVHLYTSELAPTPAELTPSPWLTAQAPWVTQSQHLAAQIGAALSRGKIPLVNNRASVRPVDSLTCPALVVELAPSNGDTGSLTDSAYQQRVAEAIVGALVFWQNQAQPPPRLVPPPPPAPVAAPSTTTTSSTSEVQP